MRQARWALASTALFAGALLGLGGCAGSPQVTPMSLADGSAGQVVDCDGFRQSMNDCIEAANEVCDGDYELLASTQGYGQYSGDAAVLGAYEQALLVRCSESAD